MTGWILDHLNGLRLPLHQKLVIAMFAVPFAVVGVIVDALLAYRRAALVGRVLAQTHTRCPRGHEVSLHGAWQCQCGFVFEGSVWGPCPLDGAMADHAACSCGASIASPLRHLKARQ